MNNLVKYQYQFTRPLILTFMKPTLSFRFFRLLLVISFAVSGVIPAFSQPAWTYRAGFGQNVTGVNEFGKGICVDGSGNVYMTGQFAGTVNFDPAASVAGSITASGQFDGFVASYTSAGTFRWVVRFGGTLTDQGLAVATSTNDVFVTGNFNTSMTVGSSATVYNSAGSTDVLVIKLTAATGATGFVTTFGGTSADVGQAIAVDAQTASANVYVTGNFTTSATFGAAGVRSAQGGSATDLFVTQLTTSGSITWASTGGAVAVNDNITGSAVCYVPGSPNQLVVVGSARSDGSASTAVNYTTASPVSAVNLANTNASPNNADFVLLEVNAGDGAFISGSIVGGVNNEEGLAISYDANTSAAYFTGYFASASVTFPGTSALSNGAAGFNNVLYGRYNPAANTYMWVREADNNVAGSSNDVGLGITAAPTGNIWLTGYFRNTISFPTASTPLTLTASGTIDDPFLVKVDAATGNATLATQGVGTGASTSDRSNAVAASSAGDVWITGQYASTLTFSPLAGLTSVGAAQDIFQARFSDPPPVITGQPSASTACAGLPASFTVTATGTGLTYQWQESTNPSFTSPTTLTNTGIYSTTTTATLNISDNTTVTGRYYRAIVTNSGGSVTSNGALLTATTPILGGNASVTQNVNTSNNYYYGASCAAIARIVPSGGSPITGSVTSQVWVEGAVPTFAGQPFVQRHYQITPAVSPGTATATVTLYFSQAEFDNFNAAPGSTLNLPTGPSDAAGKANLRVGKFNGSSGDGSGLPATYSGAGSVTNPTDGNIVWNATYSRWEVTFDVAGFSGFIVQTYQFVLPVELVSFSAQRENNDIRVRWVTAEELNSDYFELERSTDGRTYTAITRITSTNSTVLKNYEWPDTDAASLPSARVFYRLKIVGLNGSVEYSNTVIVQLNIAGVLITSVQPNPFRDKINLSLNMQASGRIMFTLGDASGRILRKEYVQVPKGFSTHTLTGVEHLSNGIYFITANFEGEIVTYKLVK
jgi:trimeric autotransporter adhesin